MVKNVEIMVKVVGKAKVNSWMSEITATFRVLKVTLCWRRVRWFQPFGRGYEVRVRVQE